MAAQTDPAERGRFELPIKAGSKLIGRSCGLVLMRRSFVSTAHPRSLLSVEIHSRSGAASENFLRNATIVCCPSNRACRQRAMRGLRLLSHRMQYLITS